MARIGELTATLAPRGHTHCVGAHDGRGGPGDSKDTVARVWKEPGLTPHRVDTFKVSNDPVFTEESIVTLTCT